MLGNPPPQPPVAEEGDSSPVQGPLTEAEAAEVEAAEAEARAGSFTPYGTGLQRFMEVRSETKGAAF